MFFLGLFGNNVYICTVRVHHASRRTAYQGGTFFICSYMKYNKQPLDIPAQIAMLKGRGLNIADEKAAEETLNTISYFRLAAYLRPMEADKNTHQYKQGASFENAVALYEFNAELRELVFHAISSRVLIESNL